MPSAEHEAIVETMLSRRDQPAPDLETMRAGMEKLTADFPLAEGTECLEDVADEEVVVTWVRAQGMKANRAMLYFHGGGYVMGSPDTHKSLASRISEAAGIPVLLVDYALAPEAPFPRAVDEAMIGWRFLMSRGLSPERCVIGGDSAGGGLALALLQRIRAEGGEMPAGCVCLSPWADLAGTGDSAQPGAVDDPMVTREGLQAMGELYAGDRLDDPEASPVHADPAGFPPLLIQVGTRECLLDDARRVAEKARDAGVDVTLEEEEGLIHVWQMFPDVPESDAAVGRIGQWITDRIG